MGDDIEQTSVSERVVLLSMSQFSLTGQTPVHTGEVVRAASDHLDAVETETLGKLDEAAVNRALNRLESKGFVEMAAFNRNSPVGKGRPTYTLDVDVEHVIETLGDDDTVAGLVDRIRNETEAWNGH